MKKIMWLMESDRVCKTSIVIAGPVVVQLKLETSHMVRYELHFL